MILQPGQNHVRCSIGDGEQRDLLALHELLDQHLGARRAESVAFEHAIDCLIGLGDRLADNDALPGCQARRLDHHGRPEPARSVLRRRDLRVHLRASRRDPLVQHELFRERLRRLNLRGGLRRSEDGQTGGPEVIDDARSQRRLGANDREIDGSFSRERCQRSDLAGTDRNALRQLGDAWISGRRE